MKLLITALFSAAMTICACNAIPDVDSGVEPDEDPVCEEPTYDKEPYETVRPSCWRAWCDVKQESTDKTKSVGWCDLYRLPDGTPCAVGVCERGICTQVSH